MKQTITKTIWKCDRCGEDVKPRAYDVEWAELQVYSQAADALGNAGGARHRYDLCGSCLKSFYEWLEGE